MPKCYPFKKTYEQCYLSKRHGQCTREKYPSPPRRLCKLCTILFNKHTKCTQKKYICTNFDRRTEDTRKQITIFMGEWTFCMQAFLRWHLVCRGCNLLAKCRSQGYKQTESQISFCENNLHSSDGTQSFLDKRVSSQTGRLLPNVVRAQGRIFTYPPTIS